jgi:hypothetical protein
MADETNSSIRITNAQVYAELMEIKAIQIELVTEFRGMKDIPRQIRVDAGRGSRGKKKKSRR